MSTKSRAGKAAWARRAETYPHDLARRIERQAQARMKGWAARGQIPLHVRTMARLAGRPISLPEDTSSGEVSSR